MLPKNIAVFKRDSRDIITKVKELIKKIKREHTPNDTDVRSLAALLREYKQMADQTKSSIGNELNSKIAVALNAIRRFEAELFFEHQEDMTEEHMQKMEEQRERVVEELEEDLNELIKENDVFFDMLEEKDQYLQEVLPESEDPLFESEDPYDGLSEEEKKMADMLDDTIMAGLTERSQEMLKQANKSVQKGFEGVFKSINQGLKQNSIIRPDVYSKALPVFDRALKNHLALQISQKSLDGFERFGSGIREQYKNSFRDAKNLIKNSALSPRATRVALDRFKSTRDRHIESVCGDADSMHDIYKKAKSGWKTLREIVSVRKKRSSKKNDSRLRNPFLLKPESPRPGKEER